MSESIYSHILLYEQLSWRLPEDQDKIRPTDVTNRSKFLNSLALVLNGNEACTAVYTSEADKTVYIARNGPIKASDRRYFDRFFSHIKTYAHSCFDDDKKRATEEIKRELDSDVFQYNSKKIIRHFIGRHPVVVDRLREMVQYNTDERRDFIKVLRSNPESYRDRFINDRYMVSDIKKIH